VATLGRARAELDHLGGEVLAVPCDLADFAQVESMVRVVREWFGSIDVLINNAGIIVVGPEAALTLDDHREVMAVNYWGAVHAVHAVLPEMRRRPGSRIVNIGSIGGLVPVPHLLPYTAAKFALTGFSETLRAELARDGIVVTTVSPGLMRTGSPPNALFKGRNRAEYAWFSICDSLPGLSVSAEHAAERILDGCRRGSATVHVPWPVRLAAAGHRLAPEVSSALAAWVNGRLPDHHGPPTPRATGWDSQSAVSPSWITRLGDRATERNNQTTPVEERPAAGAHA
jgi:NAD(P)-dependent dehydrogenase (short-subunit alcohol dehydrogenase family)